MNKGANDQEQSKSPDARPSTKLSALLFKLRPLTQGTIMPFSGELVHGAWLNWLKEAAPDLSQTIHKGNHRRPFTCSSLQFPYTNDYITQAQRDNKHLPLDPQKIYFFRITLLQGDIFPLLYTMIMKRNEHTLSQTSTRIPALEICIGKQAFALEEIIANADHPSGWTGFATFEDLIARAKAQHLLRAHPLAMEFASLTTFSRIHNPAKLYLTHYARLPLPSYVFEGLARRWQELAPPELTNIIHYDRLEKYIANEGIIIDDYRLQTHSIHFSDHTQPGFIGTCHYLLRGPDEPREERESLTIRQQILLLSQLAFYTGVGYRPTMGMGQARVIS